MKMDVNIAVMKGDYKRLRKLVEDGGEVNGRDSENRTPLMVCCLHNGEKWAVGAARILLNFGAKVGHCDQEGRNALMYAIMYEREDLVKLYLDALDYGLSHKDKSNRTILWYATMSRNEAINTMITDILKRYHLLPKITRFPNLDVKYKLPYRKIDADIWDRNERFSLLPSITSCDKNVQYRELPKINNNYPLSDWRYDFLRLQGLPEFQLSSSYCAPDGCGLSRKKKPRKKRRLAEFVDDQNKK
ncbi:Hypothetical predicted protein [Pelobates cultripes]|uniref:Ankyrin repeat protein n=1 Tax=Pelobates cultripes TaxID=61616 RepID=A0AAD1SSS5_PELCU|nr:Hypothetical predicted protein [Pelobates cultripes]